MTLYEVFVRDANLDRQAQIDRFSTLRLIRRFNRPGSWRIEGIPAGSVTLTAGSGVVVHRDGEPFLSGPLTWPNRRWDVNEDVLDAEGVDDMIHLWDRIALPSPADGNIATQAHDVRTGACETVLHGYVNANAGPAALSPRRVQGLTLAADNGAGTTVTGRARFQVLGDLLGELAVAGGDLGFNIVQDGTDLEFSVYEPTDNTAAVVFSPERGNLAAYEHDDRAPTASYVYVAGAGEDTGRSLVEGGDSEATSRWGRRIERFVDYRSTASTVELEQRRDEELATNGEQVSLEVVPFATASTAFGTHYGLGDQVTAVVDGVALTLVVREVRIDLTANGGESVSTILATPQGTTPELALFAWLRQVDNRIRNMERR